MEQFIALDGGILLWIQEVLRTPLLTALMIFFTRLNNSGAIWIALGIALCIPRKTRMAGAAVLLALALQLLIGEMLLKPLIGRLRPFLVVEGLNNLVAAGGYSFPSGHTGSSFAAASALWRAGCPRAGAAAMVLAVLIGFSRLYVGVHFPTDVLGGVVLGCACGMGSAALVRKICTRMHN